MQDPIDFWFMIGSTYTYLTVMRLTEVSRRTGVEFRWRPFRLRTILDSIGPCRFPLIIHARRICGATSSDALAATGSLRGSLSRIRCEVRRHTMQWRRFGAGIGRRRYLPTGSSISGSERRSACRNSSSD